MIYNGLMILKKQNKKYFMSSLKGLIKVTSYWNRVQQKRDWKLIIYNIGKDVPEPDWNKSVNKIDKYMEGVCIENNIIWKEICGVG